MLIEDFGKCEICNSLIWAKVYEGPVRNGAFGQLTESTTVAKCCGCGVERLSENVAKRSNDFYETKEYRSLLKQNTDATGLLIEQDMMQIHNQKQLWPIPLRQKTVADVGAGAGGFLDHICGLASRLVAIEPCREYHNSLASRGYEVYSYVKDAVANGVKVDLVSSYSVIEHVQEPRKFLEEIFQLLNRGGQVIISTPNRGDALMSLLPDVYPSFFYRSPHRWYFDRSSLSDCATKAGFVVDEIRCVHRYGLSNALIWLRDRCPGGQQALPFVGNKLFDDFWGRALESQDGGDYLYAFLSRPD